MFGAQVGPLLLEACPHYNTIRACTVSSFLSFPIKLISLFVCVVIANSPPDRQASPPLEVLLKWLPEPNTRDVIKTGIDSPPSLLAVALRLLLKISRTASSDLLSSLRRILIVRGLLSGTRGSVAAVKKHPSLVNFGKKIRKRREELGISQEELADRAGLDRTYIGGVERGERNLGLLNLLKIAIALNTTAIVYQ